MQTNLFLTQCVYSANRGSISAPAVERRSQAAAERSRAARARAQAEQERINSQSLAMMSVGRA